MSTTFALISALLVAKPPSARPLPAPATELAMPLMTSVPAKVLLLLRRLTRLPALTVSMVTVPLPLKPPSR